MSRNLTGLVVVVTGGAEGLGYCIAREFVKHAVKALVLLDINEKKGQDSAKELNKTSGDKVVFMKCDVTTDLEEVFKMITDKYGSVDLLVNNAGIVNETSARKTLEVNTIAVMEWTMKFWDHMRTDNNGKGGTILNIASIYGFVVDPYMPFYKASKYAVMGFTKTLGHEDNFKASGVRIVALCPGFTQTAISYIGPMYRREQFLNFLQFMKESDKWQQADAVGPAAVQVYQEANSGTAWKIEGGLFEQVIIDP